MRKKGILSTGCTLGILWLLSGWLPGQSGSRVQLDLGMDVAGPGQHVNLPLTFSTNDVSTVTRIVLETTFSPQKLLYSETLPGEAAESREIEIVATLVDSEEEGEHKRLRVDIASPQGIPAGELAHVSFQIAEGAELNEDILVTHVSGSIETLEGGDQQVSGSDGLITVIANAFFSCFFYMH